MSVRLRMICSAPFPMSGSASARIARRSIRVRVSAGSTPLRGAGSGRSRPPWATRICRSASGYSPHTETRSSTKQRTIARMTAETSATRSGRSPAMSCQSRRNRTHNRTGQARRPPQTHARAGSPGHPPAAACTPRRNSDNSWRSAGAREARSK